MLGRVLLVLSLLLGCDREPEKPSGGLWEPCVSVELACTDPMHECLQVSDGTVCVPGCSLGETCPSAPSSSLGMMPSARCDADESVPNSRCIVDCLTSYECPTGMTCLFDEIESPETLKGVCAWLAED